MNASVQKLTPQARRAVQQAQEEALRLSSRSIDTEHVLLGLIREGHGTAARILASMGVELPKLRRAIEFISDERRRVQRQVSEELGPTPRVKRAIELAVDEARRLGHHCSALADWDGNLLPAFGVIDSESVTPTQRGGRG